MRRDAETPRHVAAHRPYVRQADWLPAPVATSSGVRQSDPAMHGRHRRGRRAGPTRPGDRPHRVAVEAISAVVELERTGSPKGKLVIVPHAIAD